MQKYYWPEKDAIVCLGENPTPDFWNRVWNQNKLQSEIIFGGKDRLVIPQTKKYLQPGVRILEGGCGTGKYVFSLIKEGYESYGVDTAKETVAKVKKLFPELPIQAADVKKLPFKNDFFAGYWSIGVIEHFFDGFDPVAGEMARVIKSGGYLFLTFPYISPLRRFKINLNFYPRKNFSDQPKDFYQFLLSPDIVRDIIEKCNFQLVEKRPFDGYKGLKEEIFFHKLLELSGGIIKLAISGMALPFASHSVLMVFRKK